MKHLTRSFVLATIIATAMAATAKDTVQVQVVQSHAVTHEDRGLGSLVGSIDASRPRKYAESYNLDAIVNGEHVVLACDDMKGCEAPAAGTYEGELQREKWVRVSFEIPLSHKQVTHRYKIAGSW